MTQFKRVVIVGGGTAGWMTAAALVKALGPGLDIRLIESDEIGTVGVGEATIPAIRNFHLLLELDEAEFMREVNGTFKLGIEFVNWGQLGDSYFHPFGPPGVDAWAAQFHHYWLRARKGGEAHSLDDFSFEAVMARAGKFGTGGERQPHYAYHFDASRYAALLRRFSEKLGVRRTEGLVDQVMQDPHTGYITELLLHSGERVAGDLFIDCTGFRGLLIEKTLNAEWEDWSHWLRNDRAVAVQTELAAPAPPFTRATARSSGWQWKIPLQNRVGNGLVFSSDYLSEDAAKKLLEDNLDAPRINDVRTIRFRTGRRPEQWKANCIAIGLSSGFLEPLESTSIHLIQNNIIRLIKLFPADRIHAQEVRQFNEDARIEFDAIRDFIILHYHLTQRADSPYWTDCREMAIPDSLTHKIELFRSNARAFRDNNELFAERSWAAVMLGQGLSPAGYHPFVDNLSERELRDLMRQVRTSIARLLEPLPTHSEHIVSHCAV
jgi:tryptophan halogenase